MELWIRSQDRKSLKKVCDLSVSFGNAKYGVYEDVLPLGYYETEERALEVLDEIQSYLIPKLHHVCDRDLVGNNVKVLGLDSIQTMVYEMPLE
jgi:hypothetical protein